MICYPCTGCCGFKINLKKVSHCFLKKLHSVFVVSVVSGKLKD